MQINLNGLVSPSPEEQANRFKAELLKSFGISGTGFENQSFLDIFGAPGHSALGTAALRDVEQMRGWNFTAILAKALQFGLGNLAVVVPPHIAQAIADVHGEEYQASKKVNGTEQYGVPEDWVIAPRQHRIAKILREPNKWTDEATFLFQIAEQTDIHGVAHILVLPDGTGFPKELWVIPKSAIRPYAPSHKYPEGSYKIGHLSKLSINMQAEAQPQSLQQALARISNKEYSGKYVISVGLPSPVFLDDFLNTSSAISDVIDTDKQIHVSRRNSLEQMMTNGPRFEPLPGVTLDNDQWNKMMDEFVANSTGPSRQGQPWRSPAGVKVVQDGQTNRELELAKAADQSRDHTLGQRLMNSSMLGLGAGGSYAQVIGLIKGNARLVLQPLMRIYSGQITLGLRRFYEAPQDQFMTILQAANIDDPEQRRAEIDLLMNAGAIEVGEVRQAFNMMLFNDERDKKIAGSEKQQGQDPFGGFGGDGGEDYGPQDSGSPELAGVGMPETGDRPEMTTTGMVKGTESEQPKYGSLSRREFARHQKNIFDILNKLSAGEMNAKAATLMLETIGLSKAQAQEFVATVNESTIEVNGANAMTAGGGTETATALFSRMLSVKSGFTKSIIDDQAKTAATHPDNGLRMPTEKDLKAGLYKKGKVRIAGLQVEIENPVGSIRSGKRPDGTRWTVEMCDHYGYIVGAVGYDKDQLDIFVRAGMEPEFDGKVFIINQADSDGEFDEHKCFIGCQTKAESIVRYLDNYSDNWADRIMSVSELTIPQFKAWMFDPNGGPIEGELTPDKALRYKNGNVAVSPHSEEVIEEAKESDSEDFHTEELIEANPMRFQEGSGFFRADSTFTKDIARDKRDGDGDGLINDGTPQERPVSQAEAEKKEELQPQAAKPQPKPITWAAEVTPEQFIEAKGKSTKATFLSQINADDLRSHTFVLSEDGTVGAAVSPEGDIQNVFNNNGPKGAAAEVMIEAIKRGGKTLDCYAGFLPGYYSNFGFVETGRIKFNREYAPDGWDYERFGEPDVVFMGLPEQIEDDKARANVRDFRTSGKQTTPTDRYYEGDQWDTAKSDSRTVGVRENVGTKSWKGNDGRRNPSVNRSNGRVGRDLKPQKSAEFVRSISQEELRDAAKEYSKPESRNAGSFRYATPDDLIPASTDDTQQRAELIAEILTGVYGDSALRLISDGEDFTKMATLFKAFSDGLAFSGKEIGSNRRRRNPNADPRDADGDGRIFDGTPQERPAGVRHSRNTQEHISQVHAYVENALKGERTPQAAKDLADKLSTLTVKQLTDLKNKYGITVSGTGKKDLVEKIAKSLDSKRTPSQSAKPAESTTDKKEKLDKIGADFLDSLTPDANGRLVNNRLSKATVKFSDTDVPRFFESLKLQTQVDIRKAYTNDIAEELKADDDFKFKLRITAIKEVGNQFTNEARSFPGATPEESKQNQQAALLQEAKALLSPNSEWVNQKIKAEIEHRMLRVSKVTLYDYGRSKGLIKGETAQDAKNVLKKLGIEESEVASMIGAPDDWTVDVRKLDARDMVTISAQSPLGEMMRTVKMQDGQLVIKNNIFKLKPEAPKGLGLQIFSQQVAFAQSKGVTKIVTSPVREDSAEEKYKFVGYAVWPQFGYDADIFQITEPDTIEQVQQKFPNAKTIRDIYDTPGGQEWWWKNGVSIGEATFELSDDSRNNKALQAYMSKKKQARQQVLGT